MPFRNIKVLWGLLPLIIASFFFGYQSCGTNNNWSLRGTSTIGNPLVPEAPDIPKINFAAFFSGGLDSNTVMIRDQSSGLFYGSAPAVTLKYALNKVPLDAQVMCRDLLSFEPAVPCGQIRLISNGKKLLPPNSFSISPSGEVKIELGGLDYNFGYHLGVTALSAQGAALTPEIIEGFIADDCKDGTWVKFSDCKMSHDLCPFSNAQGQLVCDSNGSDNNIQRFTSLMVPLARMGGGACVRQHGFFNDSLCNSPNCQRLDGGETAQNCLDAAQAIAIASTPLSGTPGAFFHRTAQATDVYDFTVKTTVLERCGKDAAYAAIPNNFLTLLDLPFAPPRVCANASDAQCEFYKNMYIAYKTGVMDFQKFESVLQNQASSPYSLGDLNIIYDQISKVLDNWGCQSLPILFKP